MPGSSSQLDNESNRRNKGRGKGRGYGGTNPIPKTEKDSRIKPERLTQNYWFVNVTSEQFFQTFFKSGIPFHEEIALDKANSMVMILNRTYTSLLSAAQDLKGSTDPICIVTMKQVNALKTEIMTKTKEINVERKKNDINIAQLKQIPTDWATTVMNANKAIKTTWANAD